MGNTRSSVCEQKIERFYNTLENDFLRACKSETLENIKNKCKIYRDSKKTRNSAFEKAVIIVCDRHDLIIVEWLLFTFKNIDISDHNYLIFREACKNGQLEIAKKLREYDKDIQNLELSCTFVSVCSAGHLETAKWLLENYSAILNTLNYGYAAKFALQNGKFDVAEWLIITKPSILKKLQPYIKDELKLMYMLMGKQKT